MRFAFYVDTPLQLMNCVNFVWHDIEGAKQHSDLYIAGLFEKYPHAIRVLEVSGIFCNIYVCEKFVNRSKNALHFFKRIYELLCPRYVKNKYCQATSCKKNTYDVIVFSAPVPFVIALADLNKKSELWLIEDGSACYYGNHLQYYVSNATHIFYKILHKGVESLKPRRLYVNNPTMCQTKMKLNVLPLPNIQGDNEFKIFLNEIFGYDASLDTRRKIIFLSQPFDEITNNQVKFEESISEVFQFLLHNHCDDTVIRKHPREHNQDYYGIKEDDGRVMWELFCTSALKEESVLIGIFSTAQLTPKLLFDIEPYVILLHRALPGVWNEQRLSDIDNLLLHFKKNYKNSNKVMIPNSLLEFKEMLCNISKSIDPENMEN